MKTILLDQLSGDLVLDISNNIAVAESPYALAQDAASAIKLFEGELYYDVTKGVPYFTAILGKLPPIALIKQHLADAALTVPGVTSARVFLTAVSNRTLSGQVQISDATGITSVASF